MKMTFQQWISGQTKRQDPIGDLARDISLDVQFNRKRFGFIKLLDRLDDSYACPEAIRAAYDAKDEYDKIKASNP